jgi:3-methyl-2-oxobutanoate hydroxymethyltransferase
MILLEGIPDEVGAEITKLLPIPILGIGAGAHTDGQLLISGDTLGLFQAFTPKFVKKYANLAQTCIDAYKAYVDDVHNHRFPTKEHFYGMPAGEAEEFRRRMSCFKFSCEEE